MVGIQESPHDIESLRSRVAGEKPKVGETAPEKWFFSR